MHVTTKKMAFAGLTLALTVLAVVLSGILEMNTLFLLAAAAYLVGIIIRECGIRFGAAFYLAAILLGMILAPNKLYCITFGGLGFYILGIEFLYPLLGKIPSEKKRTFLLWIARYLIFNLVYLPVLFFLPSLIFPGGIRGKMLPVFLLIGQAALFVYDRAYEYFQARIWGTFRRRLNL